MRVELHSRDLSVHIEHSSLEIRFRSNPDLGGVEKLTICDPGASQMLDAPYVAMKPLHPDRPSLGLYLFAHLRFCQSLCASWKYNH